MYLFVAWDLLRLAECVQTVTMVSSTKAVDEAFFNHTLFDSVSSLLLMANTKQNALYVLHLENGCVPPSRDIRVHLPPRFHSSRFSLV